MAKAWIVMGNDVPECVILSSEADAVVWCERTKRVDDELSMRSRGRTSKVYWRVCEVAVQSVPAGLVVRA